MAAAATAAARAAFGALVGRRFLPAGRSLGLPAIPRVAVAGLGASPGAGNLLVSSRSPRPQSTSAQERPLPKTSLTSPPWPKIILPDPEEETQQHREVLRRVNELIATGQYGRLFAVVHFASRQWKVTNGDLILIENTLDAKCGERIRMEKVLLVGADDFTLIGKPLLGLDLVRVEATVIEKTESWPKIYMKFKRRKNFRRKKSLEPHMPAAIPYFSPTAAQSMKERLMSVFIRPQTVLRINTVEIAPSLS